MTSPISTIAISQMAQVNPSVRLNGLTRLSPVSFIRMADVAEGGGWIGNQTRPVGDVRVGYTPFQEHDVLFAKITPCMENGKGAYLTGLVNEIGFGSTEFHVLRARNGNDPKFLYHWLQATPTRQRAMAFMGGSAGQQRVQPDFFDHYRVPALEPDAQGRIAVILDTIDVAIERTGAVIRKLKQVRAGLLHDLLTRGLDDNGELRDPDRYPEQFQDLSLGRFPCSWTPEIVRGCLRNNPQNGVYKPARQIGKGVLLIGQTCIDGDRRIDIAFARRVEVAPAEMSRYRLAEGDILVSRVFATLDGVGQPAVVPALGENAVYESNMMRLWVDRNRVHPRLLFELLRHPMIRARIVAAAHLSNQASINQTGLNSIPLLLPPLPEQREIVRRFELHEQTINAVTEGEYKLKQLKSGLMSDLLTGRVPVPESITLRGPS